MRRGTTVFVLIMSLMLAVGMIACGNGGGDDEDKIRMGITVDSDGNTVTFFNAETLEAAGTIDAECDFPFEVVMSQDGSEAYVLCFGEPAMVSIVSMNQQAVLATVTLSGDRAYDGVIGPDGYLYVAYDSSSILSKVLVAGSTPAEVDTIPISANGGPILVSNDGDYLYVAAHQGDNNLSKIEIASGLEVDNWTPGYSYLYDMALDEDGRLFLGSYDEYEIPVWNTVTDSMMDTFLPLGVAEVANGLLLEGGKLYISNGLSYNTEYDNGALTIVDTDLTWDDYDYAQDDDSSYEVALPFSFPFMSANYDTIYFSSNGNLGLDTDYSYDQGAENILGFAPNNEDLDSGDGYFNYSHRTFADHVVFQWSTATDSDSYATSTVTVFEAVVFDDGRVRFDYLHSMPGAIDEDDEYEYGVGDGSGTAVVGLRGDYGSPFELERLSLLWDPSVSETSMTEVPFQWEGSGALHLPLVDMPHGIAMTDEFIFLPCPKHGYDSGTVTNVLEVYDRATMLPAGTVTVGQGPRGIAIQP